MDLIVLESPNKVRDVEKYAKAAGFPDCKVTATIGHLLDLPPMADGPAVDTRTFGLEKLQPRDNAAAERVSRLRTAITRADRVIVATDPDREGEAIAAEVWPWIPPGKAWRATFEEITPAGVAAGLRTMRPDLDVAAVDAAHTRRVIDRLAGWHGTDLVFQKLRQHRAFPPAACRARRSASSSSATASTRPFSLCPPTAFAYACARRPARSSSLAWSPPTVLL